MSSWLGFLEWLWFVAPFFSMLDHLRAFIELIARGEEEVYNEFSLQHELGLFLRHRVPSWKVRFERNVSSFGFDPKGFIKREIDISILNREDDQPLVALELKFPRNGQYPEQMFSICKDICFIEQLKKAGFPEAYLLILADDPLFYSGTATGIYEYFRGGKPLTGTITKPTGRKDEVVTLAGSYVVKWRPIKDTWRYAIVQSRVRN